jgi:hypothetical protein
MDDGGGGGAVAAYLRNGGVVGDGEGEREGLTHNSTGRGLDLAGERRPLRWCISQYITSPLNTTRNVPA